MASVPALTLCGGEVCAAVRPRIIGPVSPWKGGSWTTKSVPGWALCGDFRKSQMSLVGLGGVCFSVSDFLTFAEMSVSLSPYRPGRAAPGLPGVGLSCGDLYSLMGVFFIARLGGV